MKTIVLCPKQNWCHLYMRVKPLRGCWAWTPRWQLFIQIELLAWYICQKSFFQKNVWVYLCGMRLIEYTQYFHLLAPPTRSHSAHRPYIAMTSWVFKLPFSASGMFSKYKTTMAQKHRNDRFIIFVFQGVLQFNRHIFF